MSMFEDLKAPPAKRPRASDSTEEDHSQALISGRSKDIWFEDGNIIISNGNTAFRVYRGQLAAQSKVFSDMFTSPYTGENDVGVHGCPVVSVSDSTLDLGILLRLIFTNERTFAICKNPSLSFDELFGIVRMSHKYGFESFESQGLDALVDYYSAHPDSDAWNTLGPFKQRPTAAESIGVIILARLTNRPVLLPMAMYSCSSAKGANFMNGWKRGDGSVEWLSDADIKHIVAGRDALRVRDTQDMLKLFGEVPVSSCSHKTRCNSAIISNYKSLAANPGCLRGWPLTRDDGTHRSMVSSDMCWACGPHTATYAAEQRRQLWKDLPKIFGLAINGWSGSSLPSPSGTAIKGIKKSGKARG